MTKGAESKAELFKRIMEIYPDAFWEDQDKILRVPMSEAGNRVEIKVTLTAAKTNLGGDTVPGAFSSKPAEKPSTSTPEDDSSIEMTQEEIDNVQKLMKELGL